MSKKCLNIEIARHPVFRTGWEMRIGNIVGSTGISTPRQTKKDILEEISDAMDELEIRGKKIIKKEDRKSVV